MLCVVFKRVPQVFPTEGRGQGILDPEAAKAAIGALKFVSETEVRACVACVCSFTPIMVCMRRGCAGTTHMHHT